MKETPLSIAIQSKHTGCTDLLLEIIISMFNKKNTNSFDRLEIELPYMVGSSNEKVPLLLKKL